jgi:hypothetical protein
MCLGVTIVLRMAGCTGCGREGDKFLGVLDLQRLAAYPPPVKMPTGSYSIRAVTYLCVPASVTACRGSSSSAPDLICPRRAHSNTQPTITRVVGEQPTFTGKQSVTRVPRHLPVTHVLRDQRLACLGRVAAFP